MKEGRAEQDVRHVHTEEELLQNPPMLINEISRLFFDRMRETDAPGSVLSQHGCRLVLLALFRQAEKEPDGPGFTQRDLVEITHLKPPTVSGVLQEMEREGLIIREVDRYDARCTRVRITPQGKAANEEIRTRLRAMGEKQMQGLSREERHALALLLLRMRENLLNEKGNDHET